MAKGEISGFAGMVSLAGTMFTLVAVLLLAWFLLRWLTKRMPAQAGSRHIKLLDRVAVAPDKCLVLVRVAEKTMLVGMSSHAIEKLCDIEDPEGALDAQPDPAAFKTMFAERMRGKKGESE